MKELESKFLNKKVRVVNVQTPFDKNTFMVGTCSFIGINSFLHKKQVTVDRCPIFIDDFNQVEIFDEGMSYWTGSK
jgi:hypothetical protein